MKNILSLFILSTVMLFASCAYHVGNIPGEEMKNVKIVHVPVVKNNSYIPQIQVMVTNAIIREIDNDGTFHTGHESMADAILNVEIVEVKRQPVRSARQNTAITEEYELQIVAKATLTNLRSAKKVFVNREVSGKTSYFVQSDLQESERQALPLAAEDMAKNLSQMFVEGW
jgi:hypothetical protein